MKQVPVATILRQALPVGVWQPGFSQTFCDHSYSKTNKRTRWNLIGKKRALKKNEIAAIKDHLQKTLGADYEFRINETEFKVFKNTSGMA